LSNFRWEDRREEVSGCISRVRPVAGNERASSATVAAASGCTCNWPEIARRRDPEAQLFPEITVSIIGFDYMRAGDTKAAIDVLKLVLMGYPDSAGANDNLADGYLRDGQQDLARQHAQKALALLDSHTMPASSWADTEQFRDETRRSAQQTLKKLGQSKTN
jgi:tetratricopeptide (TPR) repeat protein